MVKNKLIISIFVVCIVLLAAIPSVYFYRQNTLLKKEVAAVKTKQEDPKALIARVAKHILLPTGEDPTIMTVTDKEKLSGQTFFANAKNGDKVLVYEKAKKAFLYDPDADKVIEVGPVLSATSSGTIAGATPTPTAQTSYTFSLLNATLVKGLAATYEPTLLSKVPGARVVARGNAKGDYAKSLLVDVAGTHKAEVSALAQTLGLSVASMPAGESTPSADFLIILGADQK